MPAVLWGVAPPVPEPPKIGRPHRDRRKINTARRAARRNRRK